MATTNEKFTFFWNGPFSQWCWSPFKVGAELYNCAEQYMMVQKAKLFGDHDAVHDIFSTRDPALQKQIGREVSGYSDEVWQAIQDNGRPLCWNIVFTGSMAKFQQNEDLMKALMETEGTTIVEASPVDTIWGIGLSSSDPDANNRSKWRGKNWLGEVLTQAREELRK